MMNPMGGFCIFTWHEDPIKINPFCREIYLVFHLSFPKNTSQMAPEAGTFAPNYHLQRFFQKKTLRDDGRNWSYAEQTASGLHVIRILMKQPGFDGTYRKTPDLFDRGEKLDANSKSLLWRLQPICKNMRKSNWIVFPGRKFMAISRLLWWIFLQFFGSLNWDKLTKRWGGEMIGSLIFSYEQWKNSVVLGICWGWKTTQLYRDYNKPL